MVVKNYKFVTIIFSLLLFIGCEKDPIFGLERGWIWDGIDGSDSNNSDSSKIQFHAYYDGNIKMYEGVTTTGVPILDVDIQDGDILEETFKKQKYTIKWDPSNSNIYSDSFKLKKCTKVSFWGYSSLTVYSGGCD